MRQLHGRQENLIRNGSHRSTGTSFTRSMVSVAVLPRRYYLLPITIEATYFTTTAFARWLERHHRAGGAGAPPARRPTPTLVDAVVLALVGRGILRAAGLGARRPTPGGQ